MIRIFEKTLIVAVLLAFSGCKRDAGSKAESAKPGEPAIALVAASTTDAVREIATAFTAAKKGEVKINGDDSSKLATQIVEGAPAHLFLSANEKWAAFVKEKGFAKETVPLLGNTLVLVVPKGNPAKILKPEDLTGSALHRIALAGPTVPAGIYARQALKKLKLWDELEAGKKIVSGENVRVTLAYVERGEVEAGIVYSTDAKISDKVQTVYEFEPGTHDPIRYPLVLLKEGDKVPVARSFFEFLKSPQARDIFSKHGFSILDGK